MALLPMKTFSTAPERTSLDAEKAPPKPDATALDMGLFEDARNLLGQKFTKLLRYFIEDAQAYLDQIDSAVAEKDASMAVIPAHSLKSSSYQFGAVAMSITAAETEEEARRLVENGGDLLHLSMLHAQLCQQFAAIHPTLTSYLENARE